MSAPRDDSDFKYKYSAVVTLRGVATLILLVAVLRCYMFEIETPPAFWAHHHPSTFVEHLVAHI